MNFTNPKPVKGNVPAKGNPFKVAMEKFWAVVSLISTMVPGATTRDNISAKNIGVVIFVLLVSYLGVCGIILNGQWLSGIRIRGDWFYYTGIAITVFCAIEFLNTEKKVREFAIEKKLPYPNRNSVLEDLIGRSSAYNILAMLMEALSFFWVIAGIIFYDWISFTGLMIVLIAFGIIENSVCKKIQQAKTAITIGNIVILFLMLLIILTHFLK